MNRTLSFLFETKYSFTDIIKILEIFILAKVHKLKTYSSQIWFDELIL